MATQTVNLGLVTAYGIAKAKGYNGTYEEFCEIVYQMTQAVAYVSSKSEDVTNKAVQVDADKQTVAADREAVESAAATVLTNKGLVDEAHTDVTNKASQVSEDKAEIAIMKNWISSNTQFSEMYIDNQGILHETRFGADLFGFSLDANGNLVVTDLQHPASQITIGVATAYGYAKAGGYTGTEEEFAAGVQAMVDAWAGMSQIQAASESYRDEAKAFAEGTPAQVAEYGGTKSAKDWAEDAKLARDDVLEFMRQEYVYGIVTDMTVGQTDAAAASHKVVHDNMTHENVRVDQFDREPCHDWKRLLLTYENDAQVFNYLAPNDSTKLAAGGNAVLTGAAGDVMSRLPGMHRRIYRWTDATTQHEMECMLYSRSPFFNSEPEPGTLIGSSDGSPVDQLVGSFMGIHCDSSGVPKVNTNYGMPPSYVSGDKLRSIVGARPCVNVRGDYMCTMAKNNGLYVTQWETLRMIADLMAVHFGTYDIETAFSHGFNYMENYDRYRYYRLSGRSVSFGNGTGVHYAEDTTSATITVNDVVYTRYPSGDVVASSTSSYGMAWRDAELNTVFTGGWETAVGDSAYSEATLTNAIGSITAITPGDIDSDIIGRWQSAANSWLQRPVVLTFQGIEYPWGAGCYMLGNGGFYHRGDASASVYDSYILTCRDPSKFVTSYTHPNIPDGYFKTELRIPKASSWIAHYDPRTHLPVYPPDGVANFTGAANKSLCDYFYAGNGNAIYRGGNLYNGASAGPFYVNVTYSFSSAHVSIGARVASYVH